MIEDSVGSMVEEVLERKRDWLVSTQGLMVLAILYVGIRIAKAISGIGEAVETAGNKNSASIAEGARNIATKIQYHH